MSKKKIEIDSYKHEGKERLNNPPSGLAHALEDSKEDSKSYDHDKHIDPYLSWSGKKEFSTFEVPTTSLHVHELIDPCTIIDGMMHQDTRTRFTLFQSIDDYQPLDKALEFYKHKEKWKNRIIAGDSLIVMNSLLEKEGMEGKVQTVFFDPPYGIKYKSNFQPFVNDTDVKEDADSLTSEPEQIRAFRDTWEMGIHSYLTFMRDRLWLIKKLLKDDGSCVVQIGYENLHYMAILMNEIFGNDNRVATISFQTTGSTDSKELSEVTNYLLWYAIDKKKMKYYELYEPQDRTEVIEAFSSYVMVEMPDGERRKLTKEEKVSPNTTLPKGAKIFRRMPLASAGAGKGERIEPFHWNDQEYPCPDGKHWMISQAGMKELASKNRLIATDNKLTLSWIKYEDEHPGEKLTNIWTGQLSAKDKVFVVQTSPKVIERIIQMTTDPGDLVFDPTCGSGTTAFVAEQWGRRWVTCDTSRVAIALAKQRLMTSTFNFYKLKHEKEGINSGFQYKTVETVSAGKLGYEDSFTQIQLYNQPIIDKSKNRVSGPFTVEAVPAPSVQSIEQIEPSDTESSENLKVKKGNLVRQDDWREHLYKSGIRGKNNQQINFTRLEALPGTKFIHAVGEATLNGDKGNHKNSIRVVVSFGPDFAPLEQTQVPKAIREAKTLVPEPKMVIFASFQFDSEAARLIEEMKWPSVDILKVHMNADMLTKDLRKTTSDDAFWLIGQPDIKLDKLTKDDSTKFTVTIRGFDYFNLESGMIESGDADRIAMWMLDTDYDGRSVFPQQVFFPLMGEEEGWEKVAKSINSKINMDLIKKYHGTESIPFKAGNNKQIAVKIMDNCGIESIRVMDLEDTNEG